MYRASAVCGSFIHTEKGGKSWRCYVDEKGTRHHLGTYSTESLAAEALSWYALLHEVLVCRIACTTPTSLSAILYALAVQAQSQSYKAVPTHAQAL